jgi:ubiquinone/menaquinone biosynthesis C-methylase UbiE
MLGRARRRAAARGVAEIELIKANAGEIPLEDDTADLFLSYWGLHCFAEPRAAVAEAARVLKPGGRLVGASFVRGEDSLRQRLLIRPNRGVFGDVGTEEELRGWLQESGFEPSGLRRSGPMAYFDLRARAG